MVKSRNNFWFCTVILTVVVSLFFIESSLAAPQKMYSGPEQPVNETALIRGAAMEINLESCDGVKVTKHEISVLPGEHTVEMSYRGSMGYSVDTSFLKFSVEAGHTYAMDRKTAENMPSTYSVIIMDVSTGRQIKSTSVITPETAQRRLLTLEQRIKEFPQNYNFWGLKGQMLLILNKYEEALEATETCLSLSPNSALGWKQKGEALYGLKRIDEALAAIDKAILLRPADEDFKLFRETVLKAIEKK